MHALLDAASLAASGRPSEASRALAPLGALLGALEEQLAAGASAASPLLDAVADALDAEIARWERRTGDDPEARAVLRAFLGLRELLWELGVRRESAAAGSSSRRRRAAPKVQRVRVRDDPDGHVS